MRSWTTTFFEREGAKRSRKAQDGGSKGGLWRSSVASDGRRLLDLEYFRKEWSLCLSMVVCLTYLIH